ncbi:MAG: peptidoglycan-binding domain-containing protein [Gemmobacter sp.]
MRWMVAVLGLSAGAAMAEDRALILANENYRDAADVDGAADVLATGPALTAGGFVVVTAADAATATMRARLSDLLLALSPGDRVVIAAAGHFARTGAETIFLGTEATLPDAAQAGGVGISVATLLDIAAMVPGGALVLLGSEPSRLPLGPGLEQGIGPLEVPQGVTVVQGEAEAVADFLALVAEGRGQSLPALLEQAPDLMAEGFLAPAPFRVATGAVPVPVPTPPKPVLTDAERAEEDRIFAEAKRQGSIAAYEAYLASYPAGRNAGLARIEIARLRADPLVQARTAEEALGLTRDQRRAIQRQLSLLGIDPRGVDGVFGPGSRAAIKNWQERNAERVTGFLTRDQILRLTAQADRRAAELEAEAAARRAEQERQDRLYWDQTGAAGDEAGLRAYLKRHPDGLFAELAGERLAAIEDARRAEAAAQDRTAWDRARATDTAQGYRAYLAAWPNGAFAAEAQARIEALTEAALGEGDRARAEAAEAALNLNGLARTLIEQRLQALDLRPGEVDGTFDDRTRRAIRRFQTARGLPETGYLDQGSMVGLLAGGVLKLGE